MEDLFLQVKEVLMQMHFRLFCSNFIQVLYYLVEICFVVCDSHPMLFFCVTPHPLEWENFSTQFASSLANICEAVAEPELDL